MSVAQSSKPCHHAAIAVLFGALLIHVCGAEQLRASEAAKVASQAARLRRDAVEESVGEAAVGEVLGQEINLELAHPYLNSEEQQLPAERVLAKFGEIIGSRWSPQKEKVSLLAVGSSVSQTHHRHSGVPIEGNVCVSLSLSLYIYIVIHLFM